MIARRTFLSASAGIIPALASPAVQAQAEVPVRVGYVPVIGASALFLLAGNGSARQAGLKLALNKFDSGPNAIQAFASGTIDVLAVGIAPVAVIRSRGVDVSVISAAAVGGSAFVAGPALAKDFAEAGNDPARAFAAFRAAHGRPAKIGTLPPGGVPTVALHHWLWKVGQVARTDVEIVGMGIEVVQQAMLAGGIDGATLLEPAATLVPDRDPRIKRIVNSPAMFPDLPGVVLAASGTFLAEQAAAAERFVGLFVKATETVKAQPAVAASHVQAILGGGLISVDTIARALASPAISYVTAPAAIRPATEKLLAYQVELGDFAQAPATAGLFNDTVYERGLKTLSTG
ncbi:ABC transporter substrate-binding protein [Phreatobacter aquaticus]|uniref:ABC transporter substrate-binding protein n=1 Tax=Phreatobacter aquaticus TaxID=2570229 RepID=A0A4D7QQ57_9HYPH|nr:ABC transporter substrate-binding protein [Phreatobacter aquaticus]QCK87659.1 ABC transporter substrate-binding protein [Phreatobacter aquaticus]